MTIVLNLTEDQGGVLYETLRHAKLQVESAPGTPLQVKKDKLELIDSILRQLASARSSH